MKIMQSRFYKPRRLLSVTEDDSPQLLTLLTEEHAYMSRYNPFASLLDDMLPGVYLGNSKLVISDSRLGDFERCTDFHTIEYDNKSNRCYEKELCYFHPKLEIFILANTNLSNEYDERISQDGLLKISNVYYESTNEQSPKNMQTLFDTYLHNYESNEAKVSILLKETHGLVLKTHRIKPHVVDLALMYNEGFLSVHQHIKTKLTDDSKGVVLLHGIAGSGKTNYIKWLTSQVPSKQFVFIPTNMISSLTDPSFMSLLIDNKNSILVLEDCENYIAERRAEDINTDVVSSILNIADGMLSDILECQFICTFNSDISKIDNALLRKGRLIAEYKFAPLEVDKANTYLSAMHSNKRVDIPTTLAELTNIDEDSYKEQVKDTKIGFV